MEKIRKVQKRILKLLITTFQFVFPEHVVNNTPAILTSHGERRKEIFVLSKIFTFKQK